MESDDNRSAAASAAASAATPTPALAMRCVGCGAGLPAAGIDRRLGVVTCEHCGSVHEIARETAAPTGRARAGAPRLEREPVAMPERFTVERKPGSVVIGWRNGRRKEAVMLGVFAVIWVSIVATTGLLPLMLVGVLLGYLALVKAVNRSWLRADAQGLMIKQGPLPWPGALKLERDDITQLLSVMKVSTTRTGEDGHEIARTHRHYRLCAVRPAGQMKKVVAGLSSVEQALWLEQELERVLGIRDEPVTGEVPR